MNETTKNRMRRNLVISLVLLGMSGMGLATAQAADWHQRPVPVVRELSRNHLAVRVGPIFSQMNWGHYERKGPFGYRSHHDRAFEHGRKMTACRNSHHRAWPGYGRANRHPGH
jgi:hypothetical protein